MIKELLGKKSVRRIYYEDYFGGFGDTSTYYEVYVNPTLQELEYIAKASDRKEFRFVADNKTKELYVWSAEKAWHDTAENLLPLKCTFCLRGTADFDGKKLKMSHSEQLTALTSSLVREDFVRGVLKIDWHWTQKYIKGIVKYLKELEKTDWNTT